VQFGLIAGIKGAPDQGLEARTHKKRKENLLALASRFFLLIHAQQEAAGLKSYSGK
jgi:hypothetical protein